MALREFCCKRYAQMETCLLTVLGTIGPAQRPEAQHTLLDWFARLLRGCPRCFGIARDLFSRCSKTLCGIYPTDFVTQ